MFQGLESPAKQIFTGNIFLVVCCAFYLLWWVLAFRPDGGVRGMRTGWLLIPAFIFGLAAVCFAVRGIRGAKAGDALFSGNAVIIGCVAAYVALLAVTVLLLKRPVTTELVLIVGWAALSLCEINVLYGMGIFSKNMSFAFIGVLAAAAAVSLVCYVLYYGLSARAGFIDGTVPLLAAGIYMAALSAAMTL
jgi:hypothetical protein